MFRMKRASREEMQDATRYGFRDRDFFRKNDAVVVGEYYEVPVFKKNGKFYAAYLISDCTDSSDRNSCKVTKAFNTKGEAELAAMKCSVFPFLEFEERLEMYKGYIITRQFEEYTDEEMEKEGLVYSASMLAQKDLSGAMGDNEFKKSFIAKSTDFMKSVKDVKAYIDGIKQSRNVHSAEAEGRAAGRQDSDYWEY